MVFFSYHVFLERRGDGGGEGGKGGALGGGGVISGQVGNFTD